MLDFIQSYVVINKSSFNSNFDQFGQELLSTFGTDLGEVALVPVTGGVFTVTIWNAGPATALGEVSTEETLLWDRKRDGGFPGMFLGHASVQV